MRTVQLTLDDPLVAAVDRVVDKLGTTRSEFARRALRAAVDRYRQEQFEMRHRAGYAQHPETSAEFFVAENTLAWGDDW